MQITGGFLNSRKIKTAKFENIKPTLSKTRQGLFNALSALIDFEGKSFLDMFSGSAIMSFEAISRGFNPVYSIEKDRKSAAIIKSNFEDFGLDYNLFVGDALKITPKLGVTFDVIFMDPPYQSSLYELSLSLIREKNILNQGGIIVMEHPASKLIDTESFEVVKIKDYADKRVTFVKLI